MKIIQDKEVGEIWKTVERQPRLHINECDQCRMVDALIRKLVSERAKNGPHIRYSKNVDRALLDFDIDPTDWKAND